MLEEEEEFVSLLVEEEEFISLLEEEEEFISLLEEEEEFVSLLEEEEVSLFSLFCFVAAHFGCCSWSFVSMVRIWFKPNLVAILKANLKLLETLF